MLGWGALLEPHPCGRTRSKDSFGILNTRAKKVMFVYPVFMVKLLFEILNYRVKELNCRAKVLVQLLCCFKTLLSHSPSQRVVNKSKVIFTFHFAIQ